MNKTLFLVFLFALLSCDKLESTSTLRIIKTKDRAKTISSFDSSQLESIKFLFMKADKFKTESDYDNLKKYLLDSAQYCYDKILEIDSTNYYALVNLEDVYVRKKNPEKAIFYMKKYLKNVQNSKYWIEYKIYKMYEMMGLNAEAVKQLQRGTTLIQEGKNKDTMNDVDYLVLEQMFNIENGKLDIAQKELIELNQRFPQNKKILSTLKLVNSMMQTNMIFVR